MHDELFATLHHEHEVVLTDFHRLGAETDPQTRARLLFELERALLLHLNAEEQSIYPRLAESPRDPAHADALKARAEHQAMRILLRDLAHTPGNQEDFPAKVEVLQEMVERHFGEEESETFRDLREVVGEEEAGRLLARFRQERERPECAPSGCDWLL